MQEELGDRADLAVLAISPARPEQLRFLRDGRGLTMPLLSDPGWTLYRRYGFERGRWWRLLFSPSTWTAALRELRGGGLRGRPTEDVFELGGDALVDRDGVLRWIYRSGHAADRPSPAEILGRARALG